MPVDQQTAKVLRYIAMAVAFIFAIIIGSCSYDTVETGHRGVRITQGKPATEVLTEGPYFNVPFFQHIVQLNVQTLKWEAKTQAYTHDIQQADLSFTLNYNLEPTAAALVYREVGTDWAGTLISQIVFEEIKREIGQHEAVDLIADRDRAARTMENNIRTKLARNHIVVSGFQLTNIDYRKEYEDAVEAKVVAAQRAIEEQNHTVQIKEQAAQRIETARGNAEATVLNAKAEAESITIRARALEQNPKLVEWETIQMMKEKWNGQLPSTLLGNSVPLINLPK
jgi:regulator of protease activity HflC (stomatin/prohibitin superfamily)